MTQRVAVIGAGLAGLSCARVLRRAGFYVQVFEQDRVVGGRMGTARLGLVPFDHGAQYVSARLPRFKAFLDETVASGYAARWSPRGYSGEEGEGQISPWFVGTPGMSSIVRPLAENVRMTFGRRVHTLQRTDKAWTLWFDDQTSEGPFAAVAVAVPAPEAQFLLGRLPDLADPLDRVRMQPCWALMVRLDQTILPDQDVYSDMSQIVRWVSRNNSKPARTAGGDHIVVHAAPGWTRQTEDADPEAVAEELWAEVSHALSLPPVRPAQMVAHLWRYASERYAARRNLLVRARAHGRRRRRLVPRPPRRARIRKWRRPRQTPSSTRLHLKARHACRQRLTHRGCACRRHAKRPAQVARRHCVSCVAAAAPPRYTPTMLHRRGGVLRMAQAGSGPTSGRASTVAASADIFAVDQHGDVDPASHHRRGAVLRHASSWSPGCWPPPPAAATMSWSPA